MFFINAAMMKRITISLDEEMYLKLLDYSLRKSKGEMRSVSISEAIRGLLESQLGAASRDDHAETGRKDAESAKP